MKVFRAQVEPMTLCGSSENRLKERLKYQAENLSQNTNKIMYLVLHVSWEINVNQHKTDGLPNWRFNPLTDRQIGLLKTIFGA